MTADASPATAPRRVSLAAGAACFRHHPGAGPPVLFLPGLLATSFCWRHCLPPLSAVGDCYAPDFPGLGGSAPIPRLDGIAGLAAWAREFAATLGLGPVTIVASSWGGAVALRWALDAPHEVRALVLAAPANPFFRPLWRQRALLGNARWAGLALAHMPARWHARGLAAMFADPRRLTAEIAAGYRQPLRRRGLGRIVAGYVAHWRRDMAAMAPHLGEIPAPTLLLWGEQDRIVPPGSAAPLQRALAHAELSLLPDAGHAPFEECPTAFCAAAMAFLRRHLRP
ncbi:MAG: alpha/beta fold hydrolase [Terriglobales bacterium]